MTRWLLPLLLLGACERPVLTLAERSADDAGQDARADATFFDARADASQPDANDDEDDDNDEEVVPCARASDCPSPIEPDEVLCDLARGQCVECLSNDDCPTGETCEPDGDCDD